MTEIELNERIAELLESTERNCQPTSDRRCSARQIRRVNQAAKQVRLMSIISYGGYAPHRGYVDWDYIDGVWTQTGQYIKYPKNSNCQRWIKRLTSKKVRAYPYLPPKGNQYRRVFDYWWTLY